MVKSYWGMGRVGDAFAAFRVLKGLPARLSVKL